MEELISEALKGLIAAGPVAVVLGMMCKLLWEQNKALLSELKEDKKFMVNLAMRVVVAVEALTGIIPSEEETDE